MDASLKALIDALPHDARRNIVLKMVKLALQREATFLAQQRALAAKAVPTATWLNSLERVKKPNTNAAVKSDMEVNGKFNDRLRLQR